MSIDTERISALYRAKIIDLSGRRLLVSRIIGSAQEADLTEPANAAGLGRIHHFRRKASERWAANPLPIDPACAHLGLGVLDRIDSQVYQNAACNWRCWYCYVPFNLLAASPARSQWVTPEELIDAYIKLPNRPPVLDLSGGHPELTPEWILWTMEAIEARGLQKEVYLWSDDNLSSDYHWRFLTPKERERIVGYPNYGKVACFKGIDEESFSFNTGAEQSAFERQFEIFRRYIAEGIDIYAYATLTHPGRKAIDEIIPRFIDRLQDINSTLPLRTVPLEILEFGPVTTRLDEVRQESLRRGRFEALAAWCSEIERRFSAADRAIPIQEVKWARG